MTLSAGSGGTGCLCRSGVSLRRLMESTTRLKVRMAKPLSLYPPQISEWDPATAIPTKLRSSDKPSGMIGMERNSGRFSSLATICRPDNTDAGNCKLDVGAPQIGRASIGERECTEV